jgi:hypothetical protein
MSVEPLHLAIIGRQTKIVQLILQYSHPLKDEKSKKILEAKTELYFP